MKNTQSKIDPIASDYMFGMWVYNHCPNRAEIRGQVLEHSKYKQSVCDFAMGIVRAIEVKPTKSKNEIIFLKKRLDAKNPLLRFREKER